jgi:tRNA A-37 threonylcarbamoyl transferase component Bud32
LLHVAAVPSQPITAAPPTASYSPGATTPSPGELAAHFPQLEIAELLGKGGMGAVYKARQPHLDRFVALKILPPETARDPAFAERFAREARALGRLNHPHIVAVYDYGQSGDLYYVVMEYVDGVNLRQAMRAGQLTPEEALRIVPQLCDALQFAHDEGIVHRDIKPENILLDRRGRVKVADFGLAKLLGQSAIDTGLTGTQQVMGTLHYMAPEQLAGARTVDHRADIYSLGVTFYEMLTGELPLGHFPPPSRKAAIDVRLDDVVLRTLEREPADRYQHAGEVKTDLELIGSDLVLSPRQEHSMQPGRREGQATLLGYAIWVGFPTVLLLILFIALMTVASILVGVTKDTLVGAFTGGLAIVIIFTGLNLAWWLSHRWQSSPAVDVRNKLHRAGGWLFAAGIVTLLAWIAVVALITWLDLSGIRTGEMAYFWICTQCVWCVAVGVLIILGGRSMARVRRYGLAMTGSILAMMPLSLAVLLGFPVGIWCLTLLCRRDVCDEFERAARLARNRDFQ